MADWDLSGGYSYVNVGADLGADDDLASYSYVNVSAITLVARNDLAYWSSYVNVVVPEESLTPAPGNSTADFPPVCAASSFWPANDKVTATIPVSVGERSDSAVLCPDGRVLYVFVQGNAIKQGYAPSVNAFLSVDGSVTDITTIIDGVDDANCCAFRDPAGKLFMVVTWTGGTTYTRAATHCYHSPGGMGGDWSFRSTLQLHLARTPLVNMDTSAKSISQPFFTGTRWIIAAPYYSTYDDDNIKWAALWSSDDEGYNWTPRVARGFWIPQGSQGGAWARNIGAHDGTLYWFASSDIPFDAGVVMTSTDGGASWADLHTMPPGAHYAFLFTEGGHLFRVDGDGNIARSTTPGSPSGWEAFRNYPMGSGGGAIFQRLGDRFAYMHDGKVLGLRCPSGPTVGLIGTV
jgi:hypothetical protein